MRLSIVAISAICGLSLMSCGGKTGNIAQKWQVVFEDDEKMRDSVFQAQLDALDTMTVFPEDFLAMQAEVKSMPKDSLALIDQELIEMLTITNVDTFKIKMKASLIERRDLTDSMMAARKVYYDFRNDNVVKMYATDNDYVDTSTMYRADVKAKKLYLYGNPKVVSPEMASDTVIFDILYLSDDSMSLKINPESKGISQPDIKPMNFISDN
ncbi:MAG TPA: hypothetical protein VKZ76_01555 [Edaphocola sp.]|nr:hypothetical protein [Edaphocola sp.]